MNGKDIMQSLIHNAQNTRNKSNEQRRNTSEKTDEQENGPGTPNYYSMNSGGFGRRREEDQHLCNPGTFLLNKSDCNVYILGCLIQGILILEIRKRIVQNLISSFQKHF